MIKLNQIMKAASYAIGFSGAIIDNHRFVKPEWEKKYELHEWSISKRSGVSEKKLREIMELMKEYGVLEREGKRY